MMAVSSRAAAVSAVNVHSLTCLVDVGCRLVTRLLLVVLKSMPGPTKVTVAKDGASRLLPFAPHPVC